MLNQSYQYLNTETDQSVNDAKSLYGNISSVNNSQIKVILIPNDLLNILFFIQISFFFISKNLKLILNFSNLENFDFSVQPFPKFIFWSFFFQRNNSNNSSSTQEYLVSKFAIDQLGNTWDGPTKNDVYYSKGIAILPCKSNGKCYIKVAKFDVAKGSSLVAFGFTWMVTTLDQISLMDPGGGGGGNNSGLRIPTQ